MTWTQPSNGIGLGSIYASNPYGEPPNNTPFSTTNAIFYAPLQIMATGYKNGLWAVVFQADYYGFGELIVCTSDRGCGWVNVYDANNNPNASDQFLAGISVSGDSGYWIFYYTFQLPRTFPNLITQAIYIPAGASPIGATVNSYVRADFWNSRVGKCAPSFTGTCYGAGDFQQIASIPQLTASTPYIHKLDTTGSISTNDLIQNFIVDPAASSGVQSFKPNYIPIPPGTNLTLVALPVPKEAYGRPLVPE